MVASTPTVAWTEVVVVTRYFRETLPGLISPPPIEQDPRYIEAKAFKEQAEAILDGETFRGVTLIGEYAWVASFGKDSYERVMATRDALDGKASEVIKYLGGGAGIFTLAALLNVPKGKSYVIAWALPSFVATLLAMFFAVMARQPNDVAYPPAVKGAKDYADYYRTENSALAAFSGLWHLAHVAILIQTERMAGLVQVAIWCFFAAVVLLILPVLATLLG